MRSDAGACQDVQSDVQTSGNEQGKPDFHKPRGRCAIRDAKRIQATARMRPAAVFAFDLLKLEGKDLRAQPLLKQGHAAPSVEESQAYLLFRNVGELGLAAVPEGQ